MCIDKGDETMTVYAVPCNEAIMLTEEQGSEILKKIEEKKITRVERFQILTELKKELAKVEKPRL